MKAKNQIMVLVCSLLLALAPVLADSETLTASTSVGNVAPVIDDASVRIDGAVPPTAVDPLENTVSTVNITWDASDNNDYPDIKTYSKLLDDFENATYGDPTTTWYGSGTNKEFSLDTGEVGSYSLKYKAWGDSVDNSVEYIKFDVSTYSNISDWSGYQYVCFQFKTNDTSTNRFKAKIEDSVGGSYYSDWLSMSTSFIPICWDISAATRGDVTAFYIYHVIAGQGTNIPITFWLDDLKLNRTLASCFVSRGNVLYTRFEEGTGSSAHDISKEENDGTITGATWTTGKYGNALDFDGDDDYVRIVGGAGETAVTERTVIMWVKTVDDTTDQVFYTTGYTGQRFEFHYDWPNDNEVTLNIKTASADVRAHYAMPKDEWVFIAGVWDNGWAKLYINGTLKDSMYSTFNEENFTDQSADAWIGVTSSLTSDTNGTIDEVMQFNRALSAKEIEDIYNKGYLDDNVHTYSCSGTQCTFECLINMSYYDTPGTWDVSIDVIDSGGLHDTNYTTFTYNQLNAIALYQTPISYGTGSPNDLLFDSEGIVTKNTGNIDLNISLQGADLVGQTDSSYNISVSKVEWETLNDTVLWMPFEEGSGSTTEDKSAQDNDGTITGATWVTGKYGNALYFDGINDYVSTSDDPSLDPSSEVTVAGWVKFDYTFDSSASEHEYLIDKSWANTGYTMYFHSGNGKAYLMFGNGSSWFNVPGTTTSWTADTWYFVAATFNGSHSCVYKNGNQENCEVAGDSIIADSSKGVFIGSTPALGNYFNGTIDEVMIFDRALSNSEVSDLYSKGFPNPTTLSYSPATIKTNLAPRYNTTSWTRIEIPTGIISQTYSGTFTYTSS